MIFLVFFSFWQTAATHPLTVFWVISSLCATSAETQWAPKAKRILSKSENTASSSLQQKFLLVSVTLKKGKKYLCAKVFGLQRYILYADPCLNCPKISHSVQQTHNHWQYLILLPLEWWNMKYIFIFLELLGFMDIK